MRGSSLGSRVAILVVLFGSMLLPCAAAPADEVDAGIELAEAKLVRRLYSTIDWARGRKISGFRHRVCATILRIDPDHRRARSLLKYRRKSKQEPWVQDPTYREPPDWNTAMLAEVEARVADAMAKHRDAVMEILDAAPELDPVRSEAILERLVDLMPNDFKLLESRGFVEHEGRWVLPETLEGERVRRERQALLDAALGKIREAMRPDTEALAAKWPAGVRNEQRRVYGSVSSHTCRRALENMELGNALGASLFGPQKRLPGPASTILLTSRKEARAFAKSVGASEEMLRDIEAVSAQHLDSGEYLAYWRTERYRVLGGLRSVVDSYLDRTFRGHKRGWITEGLGQRLTWTAARDHGAGYVSLAGTERQRGKDETADRLPKVAAEWPAAAARILARDGPPRLAAVLTMRLNAMKAGDVLIAYGLAAYMLEARPQHLLAFAKATVKQTDANAVCEETLGADLATVTWRVRRWLLQLR